MKKISKIICGALYLTCGVIFLLLGIACFNAPQKKTNQVIMGSSMKTVLYIEQATPKQVDSLISADNLPMITDWGKNEFVDYETGKTICKKVYIVENGTSTTTYIVTGNKEPYAITKRIIK